MSDERIYGADVRALAAAMPEAELRARVDRLLEQASREALNPPLTERHGMLYASEIFHLLGVGPLPGQVSLEELRRLVTGEDPS